MNRLQKGLFLGLTIITGSCLSTAHAALYDFRWVVENTTSKEISGIVGTSNKASYDTTELVSPVFASTTSEESTTIQLKDLKNLGPSVVSTEAPLSHYYGAQSHGNHWAAHIFYDNKEYYGVHTACHLNGDDIEALNRYSGANHLTVRVTDNPETHELTSILIVKPTGICSMRLVKMS